jgi:tetratricopeptide (TPR) repeat protein
LSKTYEKIGEYEKTIEYYEKIITVSTDIKIIVITLNEIGIIYNKLCNYTEAIKYFKRTIAYKNDIPEIYLNLGVCYVSLKQYKQAEVSLLLYLKLKTDDVICKQLGDLYFYIKDYDKSIFFYKQISVS